MRIQHLALFTDCLRVMLLSAWNQQSKVIDDKGQIRYTGPILYEEGAGDATRVTD